MLHTVDADRRADDPPSAHGWVSGMPIGIQLVGTIGRDKGLLAAAAAAAAGSAFNSIAQVLFQSIRPVRWLQARRKSTHSCSRTPEMTESDCPVSCIRDSTVKTLRSRRPSAA